MVSAMRGQRGMGHVWNHHVVNYACGCQLVQGPPEMSLTDADGAWTMLRAQERRVLPGVLISAAPVAPRRMPPRMGHQTADAIAPAQV